MAAKYAVVQGTLTSSNTDLTSSGFGTVAAAIVFASGANTTNNPESGDQDLSIGIWDGTNQFEMEGFVDSGQDTITPSRNADNDQIIELEDGGCYWSCSNITDGIRLTKNGANPTGNKYVIAILFGGVSANADDVAANGGTSSSLGFTAKALIALSHGNTFVNHSANFRSFSVGAGTSSTNRYNVLSGSQGGFDTDLRQIMFRSDAIASQNNTQWIVDLSSIGTTYSYAVDNGSPGGDTIAGLALGGDIEVAVGQIQAPTTTGNVDYATTGIDPEVVFLVFGSELTADANAGYPTDNSTDGISLGAFDDSGNNYCVGNVAEHALDISACESYYSSTKCLQIYDRATANGVYVDASGSVGTEKFTLNWSTVDTQQPYGFYVAFGQATGGNELAITAGSLQVTGQAVGLTASRTIAITAGSLQVTGQAVGLSKSVVLAITAGSLQISGQTVGLTVSRTIAITAGSLQVAGQTVGLTKSATLAITAGSLQVTGQAVGLTTGRTIAITAGSLQVTGQAVTLTKQGQATLAAETATLQVTGQVVTLAAAKTLAITAGSLQVTGQAVTLTPGRQLAITAGSLQVSGEAAGLVKSSDLPITAATLQITGQDVTLTKAVLLTASTGAVTLTGVATAIVASRQLGADVQSLLVTGQDVTILPQGVTAIEVVVGTLQINGRTVRLVYPVVPASFVGMQDALLLTSDASGVLNDANSAGKLECPGNL